MHDFYIQVHKMVRLNDLFTFDLLNFPKIKMPQLDHVDAGFT